MVITSILPLSSKSKSEKLSDFCNKSLEGKAKINHNPCKVKQFMPHTISLGFLSTP